MKKSFLPIITGTMIAALPTAVFAQKEATTSDKPDATTPSSYFDSSGTLGKNSGLPTGSVIDYVLNILGVALSFVGLIAVILIIYAGFLILTSAGNEDRIAQGKSILLWSVVGIIIIASSLGIVLFLNTIL